MDPTIAGAVSERIKITDQHRESFSKILLSVYAPVTSGLVFFSGNITFQGGRGMEKIAFMLIITSSILLVLTAFVEKFGYILISNTITNILVDHANTTGKVYTDSMNGKDWETNLVTFQTYLRPILIVINSVGVLWFVMLRIY